MHLISISLVICLGFTYASNPTVNAPKLVPLYGELDPEIGNRFAVVLKWPVSTNFVKRFVDQLGINQESIKDPACEKIIFLNGDTHIVDRIRSHPAVKFVEYVNTVKAFEENCTSWYTWTWGVARVSQRNFTDSEIYRVQRRAGKGVRVYVLDSGINTKHMIFGGRAKRAINFVPNSTDEDEVGHGTSVAGLVADVSKESTIYSVKILNNEKGSSEYAIQGICWVREEAMKTKDRIVMNLSWGGKFKQTINSAVASARKAGVGVVVSAGNEGSDSCLDSPASSRDAITVASSNIDDHLDFDSNHGPCVDIIAPGTNLYTADYLDETGFKERSGTSFASPIVAGILANVLTSYNIKRGADGYDMVKTLASKDYIKGLPRNTLNILDNNKCR